MGWHGILQRIFCKGDTVIHYDKLVDPWKILYGGVHIPNVGGHTLDDYFLFLICNKDDSSYMIHRYVCAYWERV